MQFMDQENKTEIQLISMLIDEKFHFLSTDFGYKAQIFADEDSMFERNVSVQYRNSVFNREITVSYGEICLDKVPNHLFSFSIIRLPYQTIKDFFSLQVYLEAIGQARETSFTGRFSISSCETILSEIAFD